MTTKAEQQRNRANLEKFMTGEYHYIAHDLGVEMIEHSSHHFKFKKGDLYVDIWPGPQKYWCEKKLKKGTYHDLEALLKDLLELKN